MEYNTKTIPNSDVFYIKIWQQNDVYPIERYTRICRGCVWWLQRH